MKPSVKLTTALLYTLLVWGVLWIGAIGVALHWEFPQ